jgi:glycosyltransferase involved in cell wall biosynthesis
MIKCGNSSGLCRESSPAACHRCFPNTSTEEFFLRERFIKAYFECVDHFVSPSYFLKSRYVEWGIPEAKISVIENGRPPSGRLPPRALRTNQSARGRFAFFGQLNPFKGIDVLLDAISFIPAELRSPNGPIELSIYGSGLQWQQAEFRDRVTRRLNELKDVYFHGPYQADELSRLMAGIDWVLVPSIWWENSPLVIQEAQSFGRPVIVSGIGGMAEKVKDGVNGLYVPPRDPRTLADTLIRCATTEGLWEKLHAGTIQPPSLSSTVDQLLEMYNALLARI